MKQRDSMRFFNMIVFSSGGCEITQRETTRGTKRRRKGKERKKKVASQQAQQQQQQKEKAKGEKSSSRATRREEDKTLNKMKTGSERYEAKQKKADLLLLW